MSPGSGRVGVRVLAPVQGAPLSPAPPWPRGQGSSVGQVCKRLSDQLWLGAHPAGLSQWTRPWRVGTGVVGRDLGGAACGHTWSAQPPWGYGRWRQSQPAARRPPALLAGCPWGVTLRLAPWMGRGRGTGCAGHLSPLTRPPRGRPPGGWEAEMWPVPTTAPRGSRSAGGGQLGPVLP